MSRSKVRRSKVMLALAARRYDRLSRKTDKYSSELKSARDELVSMMQRAKKKKIQIEDRSYTLAEPTRAEIQIDAVRKLQNDAKLIKRAKKKKIDLSTLVEHKVVTNEYDQVDEELLERLAAEELITMEKYEACFKFTPLTAHIRKGGKG